MDNLALHNTRQKGKKVSSAPITSPFDQLILVDVYILSERCYLSPQDLSHDKVHVSTWIQCVAS